MKRTYVVHAVLAGTAVLSLSCGKSGKKSSSPNPTPTAVPESQAAAVAPAALIARMSLANITTGNQASADFSSSTSAASQISSAAVATTEFNNGQRLKFSQNSTSTLENALFLGGGYYHGRSGGHYSGGWNFPIIRGIFGFVSNVGSLIFGGPSTRYTYPSYGYGYGYDRGGNGGCGCQGGGYYDHSAGYQGYRDFDPANPPFAFGPGTQYYNPTYVWTPKGPVYNNATINPLPSSGVAAGTVYDRGIPGCTPSVYDTDRGWIASRTPVNESAPLCNGQQAPSGVGPVSGTTYTTGATSCTPSYFNGSSWQATAAATSNTAPLCDGNVYKSVTSVGTAVDGQMPGFSPVYTVNGATYSYSYASSYDDANFRYYIYGR